MQTVKKYTIILIGLLFITQLTSAQEKGVSIGKKTIDASAILEVAAPSNDKGVLLPSVTSFQRESIADPAQGLLLYDTDQKEFYFFDGTEWQSLGHFKYRKGSNAVDEEHFTVEVANSRNVGITSRLAVGDENFVEEAVAENSVAIQGDATVQGTALIKSNVKTEGQFEGYGTVPLGGIILWSGKESSIPDGWVLCIGQKINDLQSLYNNRYAPNLRGRFVVGYDPDNIDYDEPGGLSNLNAPGDSWGEKGGKKEHALTINEIPKHDHPLTIANDGNHQHIALIDSGSGGDLGTDPGSNDAMWTDRDGASGMSYNNPIANGYLPTRFAGVHAHNGSDVGITGGGVAHENRPPYYVLAFLMRVR